MRKFFLEKLPGLHIFIFRQYFEYAIKKQKRIFSENFSSPQKYEVVSSR